MGSTISSLIGAAEGGDSAAAYTLFSTLYSELYRLAKRELARRGSPASLSVTTLLREDQLAKVEPKLAELAEMKFFRGFSFSEIAALENLSERTVQRNWEKARIYLHRNIRADLPV